MRSICITNIILEIIALAKHLIHNTKVVSLNMKEMKTRSSKNWPVICDDCKKSAPSVGRTLNESLNSVKSKNIYPLEKEKKATTFDLFLGNWGNL